MVSICLISQILKIESKNIEKQKFKVMKKVLLFIWLVTDVILAMLISAISVDWWGGCSMTLDGTYNPAFLSEIWEITSHIYTWAPEGTLFRWILFLVAAIVTFGLPIVLAVYFWKETPKIYEKYREA